MQKQTKKSLKNANNPNFAQKQRENPHRENLKHENVLKMTHVRIENKKCQKMKGHMVLGDITPKTKSNLIETFISNRYSNFFINKIEKKPPAHGWLFLHCMQKQTKKA